MWTLAKTSNLVTLTDMIIGAAIILAIFIFVVIVRAFKKTSADKAFVRTGLGAARVVIDGGALVFEFFHQLKWISLETMRLTVDRRGRDALITKDRYRVDITVDFFVRVEPNDEQILRASRSLGEYSLTAESVMDLVGAKLIGALRSVAATRTLLDLHEKRDDFADNVQEALHKDLTKNGLTLESVSIVNLDQTAMSAYDQNNVFDAEGLKKIVEETAERQIRKNEIENKARVEMKEQDVEAAIKVRQQEVQGRKRQLELDRDEEYAEATQQKEIEVFKAERNRETVEFQYEQEQQVKTREISKNKAVQQAQIEMELQISQENISKDQRVKEAQIAAQLKIQTDTIEQQKKVESAGIAKETEIIERRKEREEAEINKQTYLVDRQRERDEAEIRKELALERARRDKQIGIIEKEKEQAKAEAARLEVVAEREQAEQNVFLVEQKAEAEREKEVALIGQQATSEKQRLAKQIAAEAEYFETLKRAEARLKSSELEAQAKRVLAEAILAEAEARAEGEKKLIEAKNTTNEQVLFQEALLALIERSPELMREAMKPAERISDMRVLNVTGMGGSSGAGDSGIAGKIVGSVLEAGAAWPLLKELLNAANVDTDKGLGEVARKAVQSHPGVQKLLEKIPAELRDQKPDSANS